MNLLILLSALLSALNGLSVGVRGPQVPVAVNRVASTTTAAARIVAPRGVRPADGVAALAVTAVGPAAFGWRLAASTPLYFDRRRV